MAALTPAGTTPKTRTFITHLHVDDVLDPLAVDDHFQSLVQRTTLRDQPTNRIWEQGHELRELVDGLLVRIASRVHGAQNELILQDDVTHDAARLHRFRRSNHRSVRQDEASFLRESRKSV